MSNDTPAIERRKQWYIDNAERLKKYRKEYYSRPEVKARIKKWRENNKDKINDGKRRCHENHKEEDNLRMREYRKSHKEKVSECNKAWRKNNPDKWKAQHRADQKRYCINNKDVIAAHNEVRKALKTGVLCKKVCEKCGEHGTEAHHDDYNEPLKIRWLCKRCHVEWHKNNKPIRKEILCQR